MMAYQIPYGKQERRHVQIGVHRGRLTTSNSPGKTGAVSSPKAHDLTRDLVLPMLLFAALGAMTWAVRGCSGYGASAGCLFAGITWSAAWWFIARDPGPDQTRSYSSGWIVPALAIGIAIAGNRGWMQWPSFFEGHLQTHTAKGEFAPISPAYGYVWLFIAGVPWAGIGACLLAWCSSERPLRFWGWIARLACALGGAVLARVLFDRLPEVFLPLYQNLSAQYADLQSNPNLRRLINDNRNAIMHLGFYLGCLGFEIARRDLKNVLLILTVGLVNGLGWAALANWSWAKNYWPGVNFNFWRCWESSAGISIGIAYGLAYGLVNRQTGRGALLGQSDEWAARQRRPTDAGEKERAGDNAHPNLERFAVYAGLLLGLGLSIKNGLKGWANIYLGNELYWNSLFWRIIGPMLVLGLIILVIRIRRRPLPRGYSGDAFPHAYGLIWTVLIIQNVLAQLVTGPWSHWNEVVFSLYYLILFALSAVILHHFHCLKTINQPVVP
jgi:hypothetical protein